LLTNIPNDEECLEILKNQGCKTRVIIHCCTVRAVAEEMASKIPYADMNLVTSGALLHDIGRSIDHSIRHALLGAQIAEDLGLPDELVSIILKHTGAGLDDEDVIELGLPPGDYIPRTIEEKIVAHADNLVSDNKVVDHMHSVNKLRNKGADRGADRIIALHKELSELYGEDLDTLKDIIGEYPDLIIDVV
jgi:uncharacterized protein (TIGR00295 family)